MNVVLLTTIASPDVASEIMTQGTIAGLGLSPTLFKNIATDDPSKDLFTALALPDEFTATLLVGHSDIQRLARNVGVIVAHEMGHAMGLEHTQVRGNLMTQFGADRVCLPGLDDSQVGQLWSAASSLAPPEGWRALLDVRRTITARALARNRWRACRAATLLARVLPIRHRARRARRGTDNTVVDDPLLCPKPE